jgi:hypothetical protein
MTFDSVGEHKLCFEKESPYEQLLQFEIIDERYLTEQIPGKEDIFKLLSSGRKMMQHLEKVNVNQKSMLM